MVAVAAFLDLFDGVMARHTGRESEFGGNLDSLADLVSFGVAPAYGVFLSSLGELDAIGVAVCSAFVICGAIRLARFPLVKDRRFFIGLPIPPAGLAVAGLSLASPPIPLTVVAVLIISALMVSAVPFPNPAALSQLRQTRRSGKARSQGD